MSAKRWRTPEQVLQRRKELQNIAHINDPDKDAVIDRVLNGAASVNDLSKVLRALTLVLANIQKYSNSQLKTAIKNKMS